MHPGKQVNCTPRKWLIFWKGERWLRLALTLSSPPPMFWDYSCAAKLRLFLSLIPSFFTLLCRKIFLVWGLRWILWREGKTPRPCRMQEVRQKCLAE